MDNPLIVVVAHLPHRGRPFEDFQLACQELERDLQRFSQRGLPILLLGDLNEQDLMHYSTDGLPTWRHKRIDQILYNSTLLNMSCAIGTPHCPWATLQVRPDHVPLLGETLFRGLPTKPISKNRRRLCAQHLQQRPCRMMITNPAAIQAFAYDHVRAAATDPIQVCTALKHLVPRCSKPIPPKRYVDPPDIKELCRLRSLCFDLEQRRRYSFQIFKLRAAAQTSWRRSLVQAAASGDWASRRLLQKRQPLLVAARPLLDKFHGDQRLSKSTSKTNFLNLKAKNPWTSSWTYLIVKHPVCRQRLVGQLRASSRTKPQECLVSAWAS